MLANMNGWKQKIVAFAGGLGAPGLFLISFLDSSVLTFPVINDLLLIDLAGYQPDQPILFYLAHHWGAYIGPAPIPGHGRHRYVFTLLAVDFLTLVDDETRLGADRGRVVIDRQPVAEIKRAGIGGVDRMRR